MPRTQDPRPKTQIMVWIEFLICSSLLTFFAYNLCKEGVIISEKTNIEQGVIGVFFLAIATSFPEIVTGAAAVYSLGRVGLGYGDIIGSVVVNLMILAALDYVSGKGRILRGISGLNRITNLFVLAVIGIVLFSAVLRYSGISLPVFMRLGAECLIITVIYFLYLFSIGKKEHSKGKQVYADVDEPVWKIWSKFALLLIVVMFLGAWMAHVGEKIVVTTGLSQTFTGTFFLGLATSLPEIIVSFVAIRAASADMAIGNIIGSNLFDVCIIPFLDLLTEKPILGMLSRGQILATVIALILTGIVAFSAVIKRDTASRVNWDTGSIFAIGLAGFVLLYFVK